MEERAYAPPWPEVKGRPDSIAVTTLRVDPQTNLEMCALLLALRRHQWEAANPAWNLRDRPEILATLYPLGFARSRPYAASA